MSSEIQQQLDAMATALAKHSAALNRGADVDLTDLDKQMGALCVELVNARPESTKHLPELQGLMRQLDQLTADLARRNGSVS